MLLGYAVFRRKDADAGSLLSTCPYGTDAIAAGDEVFGSGCGDGKDVTSSKYRDGATMLIF